MILGFEFDRFAEFNSQGEELLDILICVDVKGKDFRFFYTNLSIIILEPWRSVLY